MKACKYVCVICGWICMLAGAVAMLAVIGHMYFMPYFQHEGDDYALTFVSFMVIFGGAILYFIGRENEDEYRN